MEQGESGEGLPARTPDGPPPAREQLPLPHRRRQAHIEPQLRTPGGSGTGTPFAAFAAESVPHRGPGRAAERSAERVTERAPERSADRAPERGPDTARDTTTGATVGASPERAAAFHAGTRRGRWGIRPRRGNAGAHPSEPGSPPARPSEY